MTDLLKEKLEEIYDEKKQCINYIMSNVFRGLLWSVILEQEKKTGKPIFQQHIDNIIRIIIETACHTNRDDGEDYPIYSDERTEESIKYVSQVLKEKGIVSQKK